MATISSPQGGGPKTGIKMVSDARGSMRPRKQSGRTVALIFAIGVHAIFFAVLVFGVAWQVTPSAPVSAEIWSSLPPANAPKSAPVKEFEPPPEPVKPPPPEPAPKKIEPPPAPPAPPQPTRAEIELKAKKERDEKLKREQDEKKLADQKKADDKKKADEKKKQEEEKQRRNEEAKAQAEVAARAAAIASARDAAVRGYADKIAQLIRSRANIPDSVMGKPTIEVRVRFLVNGVPFGAQVTRPSGNRVYDEAVERAINGIQNWPQPDDPAILGGRRELILRIEHER
jgi:colicin import membrane protein